jgi:hypothetical protein
MRTTGHTHFAHSFKYLLEELLSIFTTSGSADRAIMSSPVVLSISTIFALIGIVLAAIAFSTDNWIEYRVDRLPIYTQMKQNDSFRILMEQRVNRTFKYFDRSYGLFRVCFPGQVPTGRSFQMFAKYLFQRFFSTHIL